MNEGALSNGPCLFVSSVYLFGITFTLHSLNIWSLLIQPQPSMTGEMATLTFSQPNFDAIKWSEKLSFKGEKMTEVFIFDGVKTSNFKIFLGLWF